MPLMVLWAMTELLLSNKESNNSIIPGQKETFLFIE
jgi:hypothetical protein